MPKRDLVKRIDLDDRAGKGALTSGRAASKQYATYVVAASNSTPAGKAAADYTCDGVSDDVEINAALAQAAGAARVLLLEGTFRLASGLTIPDSTRLEGQGEGTILQCPDGNINVAGLGNDSSLCNLRINGGASGSQYGAWAYLQHGCLVDGVVFSAIRNSFVNFQYCYNSHVVNCRIVDSTANSHSFLIGCNNCSFSNNLVYNCASIIIRGGWNNVINGNTLHTIADGFQVYDALDEPGNDYYPERSTTFVGNSFTDASGAGISIDEVERCAITGNSFDHCDQAIIVSAGAKHNVISGNTIGDSISNGMYIGDCLHNLITGNNVSGSQAENIVVDGDAEQNMIIGNLIRKVLNVQSITAAGPFTATYGIRMTTAAGKVNFVLDNDLRDGGSTANYADTNGANIYQEPGKLSTGTATALTIASDAITVGDSSLIRLLPQTGTADDLATINGGYDGQLIVLRTATSGDTITVKDGTGNLQLAGGDFAMDSRNDKLTLIYDADLSQWSEVARSNNA